tara:strand:+ start:8105 stop:8500 length:396 start_codon:yes stop_codon:yes gene_type:complete
MIRPENVPFQYDRPVFVRVPFNGAGRNWPAGSEFPWKELGVTDTTVHTLYVNRTLFHDSTKEVTMRVGDGLENLDLAGLSSLVDNINNKVKEASNTTREYDKKRCKKSKILDKQRGMIRSWRRTFGSLENT